MKCAVVNCNKNNQGKASACSFFRFPTDSVLRKKWINFCGHKKFNPDTSYVCMHHFKEEDFKNTTQYEMGFAKRRFLKDGVVPTINIALAKNNERTAQRDQRIKRRENKKIVDFLLKNNESGFSGPQENNILQPIENMVTTENIDEVGSGVFQKQSENIPTLDVNDFNNLSGKVKILEKEILAQRKESAAALKKMKDKLEKMERDHKNEIEQMKRIHNYEKEQMEKCVAKTKNDLECIEEKLQFFFTKGQIRKLKNNNKRQTWSEEDIAHSIALYAVSPKMYRLLHKKQYPLPAVRTLQMWAQKIKINRGLIMPVFQLLEASNHMNEVEI